MAARNGLGRMAFAATLAVGLLMPALSMAQGKGPRGGRPGMQPAGPGMEQNQQGMMPGQPGMMPGRPGMMPGQPGMGMGGPHGEGQPGMGMGHGDQPGMNGMQGGTLGKPNARPNGNDPDFVLSHKDDLQLTPEQITKLEKMKTANGRLATAALTKEQKQKLQAILMPPKAPAKTPKTTARPAAK